MTDRIEKQNPTNEFEPESLFPRFIIGFVLGFVPPAAYGLYGMHLESVYRASLPKCSNCGYCGMGVFASFLLLFFVAPVCGILSAGMSLACTIIVATCRR
jgi:hypothetical protein